ncbi:Ras-associated and pleckstrin y domains-containing protein 1 [Desmophyllum pertusum]|uniref:Ras-associated and pleckstrin y domains-containing protein 1 n=1 Tax=Desmophyllum pertusum TaxID=174260 RepID=A0A9W9ZRV9_9CNID|nr:Ras-associated and pleckstrin y domains-containing protein 1 [Desmophyllum pertusum]
MEDHESVVDVVSSWPWDSENKLVINNRREKYSLFRNPQNFLLTSDTSMGAAQLAEKSKDILLQEFFQKDAMRLPELDGALYLKEGKRSWKKHYFVLRASGIYYTPKGKTKSRDIVCLMKFEHVSIFNGIGFKKKLKAPTDHCFVLKKMLKPCSAGWWASDFAKFGYKMLVDYSDTQDEMDKLAFSLDRNKFTRASSFTAGQDPEPVEVKPQPEPKD